MDTIVKRMEASRRRIKGGGFQVLCLDIETTNLNADFGVVLCACVASGPSKKASRLYTQRHCNPQWSVTAGNDRQIVVHQVARKNLAEPRDEQAFAQMPRELLQTFCAKRLHLAVGVGKNIPLPELVNSEAVTYSADDRFLGSPPHEFRSVGVAATIDWGDQMRIATGGISHETSTFAPTPTTLRDFETGLGLFRGDDILTRFRGTNNCTGGFIAGADRHRFDLLPLLWTFAYPGGLIVRADYETLKSEFLERLAKVLPVDGVLLDLHGAMVVEGIDDGDGDFLGAVRHAVGPNCPIVATFDLHGNHTQRRLDAATAVIGFDTYPHVDRAACKLHRSGRRDRASYTGRSAAGDGALRVAVVLECRLPGDGPSAD
jgi:hypothetical protein